MKVFLGILGCFAAVSGADAAVLTCRFTEPFFTISYDSATGQVIRLSPDHADPATNEPIPEILAAHGSLVRDEGQQHPPALRLLGGNGEILIARVTGQGSDGMSDSIYPLEGVHDGHVGGCETDKVKAYKLTDLWDEFGVKY